MFKPIPNFENYLISEDGVHKLVAIAYLGEPEGGLEVNHIDANKTNNHVITFPNT